VLLALCLGAAGPGCGEPEEIPAEEAIRIRAIFERGLSSPDPYVRAETVRAIGQIGSPRLTDLLKGALSDDSRLVRLGATVELARLDPKAARSRMIDFVTDADPPVQLAALSELLRALPEGEQRDEVVRLGLQSTHDAVRHRAFDLGMAPRYRAALAAEDDSLKRDLKDEISRLVDHPDPLLAGSALSLLVETGFVERGQPLLDGARRGDLRAIRALGRAAIPGGLEAITVASASADKQVVIEAAVARVGLGDEAALDTVRQMLGAADPALTRRALMALGRSESSDGLRIIRPYRDDSRAEVRQATYRAMGLHKGARGDDFLRGLRDPDEAVVFAAMAGLCRSNPTWLSRALAEFVEGLDDPKSEGRRAAERQARAVLEGLISTLEELRLDGEEALIKAIDQQAATLDPSLLRFVAAQAPDTRVAAAELLFRGGDPRANFGRMKSPSPEVRFAYIDAMAWHPPADAPLVHLDLFHEVEGEMTVMDVVAGAGVWNAYRTRANTP